MNTKLSLATPPIPLADVVKYALECCADYSALAFEGHSEAAETFAAFRTTLLALATEAGDRKAVNDAVYGLVTWCLNHGDRPQVTPALNTSGLTRREVESRLWEYKQWVSRVNQIMVPLQEEKDEMNDLQQHEIHRVKYEELQKYISELASLVGPFERDVANLEHYLASLNVVERGLPQELFNLAFPSIPEMGPSPAVQDETGEQAPVVAEAPKPVVPASPERVRALAELSERYGILPIEIMTFSLFDLFGPWNANVGSRNRGVRRVLLTALDLGILQVYGWTDSRTFLKGMHWKGGEGTRGFLRYRGSPSGGLGSFDRTDKSLPWNARSLFTEHESQEFVRMMKEPSHRVL